jgi:MYXO-CTERM domain-containing protein
MPSICRRLTPIALVLLLAACNEPDRVEPEHAAIWANTGSALGVYTHLHTPVAFAVGEHTYVDATCPTTADDGTTVTITGGCTDSENKRHEGEVTITRVDGPRDLDLTFSEYGSGEGEIARTTGTAVVRQIDTSSYTFDVDLVNEGGVTVEIDYFGTVTGNYGQATTWNGSGTVTRTGFEPTGTAEVETVEQLVDDAICSGQSSSGETTIVVDGHTIVVTYDGETDCDENNAARWSLDGKDQGLVEGVTCAVTDNDGRLGAALFMFVLLGLGTRRRRTSSR